MAGWTEETITMFGIKKLNARLAEVEYRTGSMSRYSVDNLERKVENLTHSVSVLQKQLEDVIQFLDVQYSQPQAPRLVKRIKT